MEVFLGYAPDGTERRSEHELFDGDAESIDSEKIRNIVVALDETGLEREEIKKEEYLAT